MRWDTHLGVSRALCDAWGLPADKVRSISIDITAGEITTVLVRFVNLDGGEDSFQKFRLEPVGDA